jgi:putative flippase GtrA
MNQKDNAVNENEISKKDNFFVKHKDILLEILRFLIVGGLATLIEWVIAYVIVAVFPPLRLDTWNVTEAIGTAVGFSISLVFNYLLSVIFVFKNKKDEKEGKSFKDFLIFLLISLLVLGFQLLFIYLVNDLLFIQGLKWEAFFINNLTWGYIITKVFATVVGLIANYIFRKIFIFK